jgi:hypothetical protein
MHGVFGWLAFASNWVEASECGGLCNAYHMGLTMLKRGQNSGLSFAGLAGGMKDVACLVCFLLYMLIILDNKSFPHRSESIFEMIG